MPEFKIHTIETAPDASKPILTNLKSEVGFIPNLAATMAESPALLDAFTSLRRINGQQSSLSAIERELVSIVVAIEYGCSYCVAAHSTFAIGAGASEAAVADARNGRTSNDPRIAALTNFARKVARNAVATADDELRALLSAGLDPRHAFDVFSTVAQVALASQAFLLAGAPLDGAFAPRA
jgi:uncharacterized peroxidase-related enzyme